MHPRPPDPSNRKISTPNYGGPLRLIGGTQYLSNSTQILNWPRQTCRMILVTLQWESSDVAATGTFAPPHLIYAEMPQRLESYGLRKMYSIEYPGYSIECIWSCSVYYKDFLLKLYIHVEGIVQRI